MGYLPFPVIHLSIQNYFRARKLGVSLFSLLDVCENSEACYFHG